MVWLKTTISPQQVQRPLVELIRSTVPPSRSWMAWRVIAVPSGRGRTDGPEGPVPRLWARAHYKLDSLYALAESSTSWYDAHKRLVEQDLRSVRVVHRRDDGQPRKGGPS